MSVYTTPRSVRTAAAGSWLALLAATTLGDGARTLRAEIKADGLPPDGAMYRLVIQSYDARDGAVPGHDARPVGSMQRTVTADELRHGVHVNLLEIDQPAKAAEGCKPVVVAWIDAGAAPDLEFDGRTARPGAGSVYGLVARDDRQDTVRIRLDRTVA